jgi:hypothetical protein
MIPRHVGSREDPSFDQDVPISISELRRPISIRSEYMCMTSIAQRYSFIIKDRAGILYPEKVESAPK